MNTLLPETWAELWKQQWMVRQPETSNFRVLFLAPRRINQSPQRAGIVIGNHGGTEPETWCHGRREKGRRAWCLPLTKLRAANQQGSLGDGICRGQPSRTHRRAHEGRDGGQGWRYPEDNQTLSSIPMCGRVSTSSLNT